MPAGHGLLGGYIIYRYTPRRYAPGVTGILYKSWLYSFEKHSQTKQWKRQSEKQRINKYLTWAALSRLEVEVERLALTAVRSENVLFTRTLTTERGTHCTLTTRHVALAVYTHASLSLALLATSVHSYNYTAWHSLIAARYVVHSQ